MTSWIFQANPKTSYRLRDALACVGQHDMKLTWDIRQYGDQVHSGDTVYMWEAGPKGGIVAVAKAITEPGEVEEDQWSLEFHVVPGPKKRNYLHVRLAVDNIFPNPISRHTIAATEGLHELLILRFAQMTNYPLTKEHARAIDALIKAKAWDLDEPPPLKAPRKLGSTELNQDCSISDGVRESHLEAVVAENLGDLEQGLELISRQYPVPPVGRIDLLCKDGNGHFVVVELKKLGGESRSVIDQITRYMGWVKEKLATEGQRVRGIIVVGHPDERLSYSARVIPDLETKCWSMSINNF